MSQIEMERSSPDETEGDSRRQPKGRRGQDDHRGEPRGRARESWREGLLVDADPQGSLTSSLGWKNPDELEVTLATHLEAAARDVELPVREGLLSHKEGFDLMPANIELAAVDVELVTAMCREAAMGEWLSGLRDDYDRILVDCMPSLGMLTVNALAAADSVLIPGQAQYLPAKGMGLLIEV